MASNSDLYDTIRDDKSGKIYISKLLVYILRIL